MSDLISREAAIDAVSDCGICIQRILDLQPAQQWIPTSDRLPVEQKVYWVCTNTGYQCECRFTDNVYGLGTGALGWKFYDLPPFHKVVAWMNLPEPYRGGEE